MKEPLGKKASLIERRNERVKMSHGKLSWKVSDDMSLWENRTLSMKIDRIGYMKRFGYHSN
jgi:hypothetical protein